ncbi:RNase H domain-containing protein [Aphis craccivora]|uniref:RNase H domain-containing protein n=1 Tax=Aphis craccivora TaxID=307492 RepID=A0A6G0ZA08_APHCR|nr:RNase H domain-containing protein [Aphis craccivora]
MKYMIKISNQPKHISSSNFHQHFLNTKAQILSTIFENFNRIKKNINLNIDLTNKSSFPIQASWTWSPEINTDLLKYNKKTTTNSFIVSLFYEFVNLLYHDYTLIYTDASKSINGTGFAIVDGPQVKIFQLPYFSSIFTAEAYAL